MDAKFKNNTLFLVAIWSIIFMAACQNEIARQPFIKRNISFNQGWKFINANPENASNTHFDDATWRTVDLPHDISVEDLAIQDSMHFGPFFKGIEKGIDVGFLKGGTAWYRKHFVLESEDVDKQVILNFDGIQSEATLFVNAKIVDEHKYGYTPFGVDITSYLADPGVENIIAIKVVNPEVNSRWFAGFGIYRNVSLSILHPVHINDEGVFIRTPEIEDDNKAVIKLAVEVVNKHQYDETVKLQAEILNPHKTVIKTLENQVNIASGKTVISNFEFSITNPRLWDLESPNLYTARIIISQNDRPIDALMLDFGIRSIDYSAEKGFLLNGKKVLLKGACLHHDNGLLGASAFKRAEYRRIEVMKQNGYNAIRTSHNPPSTYFLDACDQLGMLVIDEAFDMWKVPKRKNDYHRHFNDWWEKDLESMLYRDRNHPSIIMWSYGNEIPERAKPEGIDIAKMLVTKIKSLDTSRPVTQAICDFWDNPDQNWAEHTPDVFDIMDIAGYNYRYDRYEGDHKLYPNRIMYGSESFPKFAFENWSLVEKYPYVIGDFVWTGMDYLGESGIGRSEYKDTDKEEWMGLPGWPWFNAWCGDIDITGNKKPQSLYRDVVWRESPLEILVHEPIPSDKFEHVSAWGWAKEFAHWNWEGSESDILVVNVYSSYPKVRLELNGKFIGEQDIDPNTGISATFKVPYQPGELKATGIGNDNAEHSQVLRTTGKPSKIILEAERETIEASRDEICYTRVSIVDGDNNVIKTNASPMEVKVTGEGELIAAGNGSPLIEGSFQDKPFNLFQGRGLIIVRSTGKNGKIGIQVKTASGFSSQIEIQTFQ